jgi:hypothetical protein
MSGVGALIAAGLIAELGSTAERSRSLGGLRRADRPLAGAQRHIRCFCGHYYCDPCSSAPAAIHRPSVQAARLSASLRPPGPRTSAGWATRSGANLSSRSWWTLWSGRLGQVRRRFRERAISRNLPLFARPWFFNPTGLGRDRRHPMGLHDRQGRKLSHLYPVPA